MKQLEIFKAIANELNTALGSTIKPNIEELNACLKKDESRQIKYRISGKTLGYLGITGPLKAITPVGIKVFLVNKVVLIKFSDIEAIQKAKPRSERPVYKTKPEAKKTKPVAAKQKVYAKSKVDDDDDDEYDDDDLSDLDDLDDLITVSSKKPRAPRHKPKTGSAYIPSKNKK